MIISTILFTSTVIILLYIEKHLDILQFHVKAYRLSEKRK